MAMTNTDCASYLEGMLIQRENIEQYILENDDSDPEDLREIEKEIELLPLSALLMTYECGIRFLGDFVNGDTYFKVKHPTHNLDRARNQFALVADMERKYDQMMEIVKNV